MLLRAKSRVWPLLPTFRQATHRGSLPCGPGYLVRHPALVQRRTTIIPAGDPPECRNLRARICPDAMGPDSVLVQGRENRVQHVNAKCETVATSPTFREALKRRRCLVPVDGFYKWQKIDAKTKLPLAIALKDGSPLAFAGLWERWTDKATGRARRNLYDHHHRAKRAYRADSQSDARDSRAEGLRAMDSPRGPSSVTGRSAETFRRGADDLMEGERRGRKCPEQ
jgi:hypothetical protein